MSMPLQSSSLSCDVEIVSITVSSLDGALLYTLVHQPNHCDIASSHAYIQKEDRQPCSVFSNACKTCDCIIDAYQWIDMLYCALFVTLMRTRSPSLI